MSSLSMNRVRSDFSSVVRRAPLRRYRPQLEALEQRTLLSAGALDPTFGSGGTVLGPSQQANSVAVQPDGKIVVAGYVEDAGTADDFALVRYNPDASLDTGFGSGGEVITDFAGGEDQAFAVALQPDGKIVAAGFAGENHTQHFALARYNANGTLDAGFGLGGKVVTSIGAVDWAYGLAVQPDGKIVAAGFTSAAGTPTAEDFALARYNPDGSLDAGFGHGGEVISDFGGLIDEARAVALQPDGKIVAAGFADLGDNDHEFALARYNPDGSLDAGFGPAHTGKVTTEFQGGFDTALAVALQGDGKIVAAGPVTQNGHLHFGLARYNTNGSLDQGFGTGGEVTTDFGDSQDIAHGVAVQGDGKIVTAGSAGADFGLARYNQDGSLDTSFGNGGLVATPLAGAAQGNAVALDPVGESELYPGARIVVAGYAVIGSGDLSRSESAVARYQSEPSLGDRTTIVIPPGLAELLGDLRFHIVGVLLGRRLLRERLWLVNPGGALEGPLWLVLAGLRPRVHLRNLTTTTTVLIPGNPTKELLPAGAVLPPGGRLSVVLVFSDPSGRPVHFVPHLLAGAGTP
jgi:uncharacterized delta-60 repeat protein